MYTYEIRHTCDYFLFASGNKYMYSFFYAVIINFSFDCTMQQAYQKLVANSLSSHMKYSKII